MRNDKSNLTDSVQAGKIASFLTLHIYFCWMLLGQLIVLLLCVFDYSSLWPVIDWISLVVPPVDSLRYSVKVMDNDLARAHHALMWLLSPGLIIFMLFFPVRQGEREWFLRASSPVLVVFIAALLAVFVFYRDFPDSPRQTLGLERFYIGFAFVSSFYSSLVALPFRCIKLVLTDATEPL